MYDKVIVRDMQTHNCYDVSNVECLKKLDISEIDDGYIMSYFDLNGHDIIGGICSRFDTYEELADYMREFVRVFGNDPVIYLWRDFLNRYAYTSNITNDILKSFRYLNRLLNDGIIENNSKFKVVMGCIPDYKIQFIYDKLTNVGKAIVRKLTPQLCKYGGLAQYPDECAVLDYVVYLSFYEDEKEYLNDIGLHEIILDQAFCNGMSGLKKFFKLKSYKYPSNDIVVKISNVNVTREFIKTLMKLADRYNWTKTQIKAFHNFIGLRSWISEGNIINVYTSAPTIYGKRTDFDPLKDQKAIESELCFYKDMSEVNSKAAEIYGELLVNN